MRNFFWEGHAGSKINHLANWNKVSSPLEDKGFGLGGIKIHNTAGLLNGVQDTRKKNQIFGGK